MTKQATSAPYETKTLPAKAVAEVSTVPPAIKTGAPDAAPAPQKDALQPKRSAVSKILVALDGTPQAAVALAPVMTVVKATGAAVQLLTVVEGGAPPSEHARITQELERVAEGLRAGGVRVETMLRHGTPATEIVAVAIELGADLITMATHGRSGLSRTFLGSVAQRVLAESPVQVMLLRPGGHAMTKLDVILVPVDGSPGGALALASAVPLAQASNARIVLVDVVVPFVAYSMMSGPLDGPHYFDPAWDDEALASARHYVSGMADRLRRAGVQAEGMAFTGELRQPATSVAEAIMQRADEVDADLIVMSTHALTGPARALLGSVADTVVRESHRPVLLPRRGTPQHAAG